ncbi:hypothetical protein, partial [Clostridium sp. UBA3887]
MSEYYNGENINQINYTNQGLNVDNSDYSNDSSYCPEYQYNCSQCPYYNQCQQQCCCCIGPTGPQGP